MKAGFFSPLPPARTGVADYSAALLRAMRETGEVAVNSDDTDVCLYHLGNNHLHRDIYRRALARPGVVVLHDAVLHHFFLGTLDEPAYVDEFVHNYGAWSVDLARDLWRHRARSAADPRYFQYPMLRRIAETSKAVIVHNSAAARLVRTHAPATPVHELPHLSKPGTVHSVPAGDRVCCPRFGVFGHLRESKRLFSILRAFPAVRAAVPQASLLVAGQMGSIEFARAVEPLLAQSGVVRRPFAPEPEFTHLLDSVDAGLNLRYPGAGETSGISIRLMALAKPVLVTDSEETDRFPADACLRIDSGPAEVEILAHMMIWLATDPRAAREIGRRAQAHIERHHSPENAARLYWEVLRAHAG
ncbi:MAG: glycosyltransferase family 4 protein [Acidobacteria bacterium]|nr:glycosyltransferase family 4 protein [Acidobacteriota bacterium]